MRNKRFMQLITLTIFLLFSIVSFAKEINNQLGYFLEIDQISGLDFSMNQYTQQHPSITNILQYIDRSYTITPNHTYINACLAIDKGEIDQLKSFINRDRDILTITGDSGTSLLHLAVMKNNNACIIQYLIKEGIPINYRNREGQSPLHLAAYINNLSAVEVLLKNNASTKITDIYGHTPIWIANIKNYPKILNMLIAAQEKQPYSQNIKNLIISRLKKDSIQTTVPQYSDLYKNIKHTFVNPTVKSLWHKELSTMGYGEIEKLLRFGMNPLETDSSGKTLLHIAALYNNIDALQYLLTYPFKITKDTSGSTALHIAAKTASPQFVQYLINIGCNVHTYNKAGLTPIFEAVLSGNFDTLSYFLKQGISPNTKTPIGRTLVHEAARLGHNKIIDLLLSPYNALYDLSDYQGKTPLYLAAEQGHVDIVDKLYRHGANVNCLNYQKTSPLHIAVKNHHINVVKLLVTINTASILEKDSSGRTALEIAEDLEFNEIADIIFASYSKINNRIL